MRSALCLFSSLLINPAETFGDIVIDYPYVECTSASIQGLTAFKKLYPGHRREEVEHSIEKAAKFIEKIQKTRWLMVWLLGCLFHIWLMVWGRGPGGCWKEL
nr:cycloartenol synthase [Ipomoea batatas]